MSRVQKDPLRPLHPEDRSHLERLSRALGLPAALVARAKVLLAVANGYSYIEAAQLAGRRTGDAVAALVSLFNRQGLAALDPRHAGGPAIVYDAAAKERVLAEFRRKPDRERETTRWLSTGTVRVKGVRNCPNAVLHAWLKQQLLTILAGLPPAPVLPQADNRASWERWQAGLTLKPTLSADLPPLRLLLILDNLAGHKTPAFVVWLFEHGIMPVHTPLSGSWLNMTESVQRILSYRALAGDTGFAGGHHGLARSHCSRLERGPHAVHLGRTPPRSPPTRLPPPPPAEWLRCLHHTPHPPTSSCSHLHRYPCQVTHYY